MAARQGQDHGDQCERATAATDSGAAGPPKGDAAFVGGHPDHIHADWNALRFRIDGVLRNAGLAASERCALRGALVFAVREVLRSGDAPLTPHDRGEREARDR